MSTAFTAFTAFPTRTTSDVAQPHGPARFTSCLVGSAVLLVTADGEIDACNARELAQYIEQILDAKRRLIVDLRGLAFFGTSGFSALHYINVACSRRDVNWVVLPGLEVSRVLSICDPENGLPVAGNLEDAIAAVSRLARSYLLPLPRK